jgi:hypothetical protein
MQILSMGVLMFQFLMPDACDDLKFVVPMQKCGESELDELDVCGVVAELSKPSKPSKSRVCRFWTNQRSIRVGVTLRVPLHPESLPD